MKKSQLIEFAIMLALLCFLNPSFSFAQKDKKPKKNQTTTGWEYNESDNSEIEIAEIKKLKLPKAAKKYFEGMKLIDGGTFNMGAYLQSEPEEKDSSLIIQTDYRRVIVSAFYISDHEVTNGEYREFTDWVRDSVCLSLLAKSDPSYYQNASLKTLNWKKRDEIFSEQNMKKLETLFYPEQQRFNNKIEFDQKNTIYSEVKDIDTFSIAIYPDTLSWVADNPYIYNEPIAECYFWHPAYDNYPVVGVSYLQAQAYCNWRTKMMNDAICRAYKMDYYTALTSEKNVLLPNFRLPTEAEWEYAALSSNSKQFINDKPYKYFVNTFPWQYEYLTDNKGNYLANFGAIFDQNSMQIKSVYEFYDYDTDGKGKNDGQGYFYSSPVKTFPPNGFGLYDMAGNVAEWVMDRYRPYSYYSFDQYSSLADTLLVQEWESWENYFIVYETDSANLNKEDSYSIHYFDKDNEIDMIDESNQDFDSRLIKANDNESIALQKLVDNQAVYNIDEIMDTTNFKSHWLTRAKIEIHNAKVVEANPNARIVKGGSWATGPAYMQCGSREILSATKTKSMVGFRICMTYIGDISISVKK